MRPARILILEFLMRQVEIRLEGHLDKKWLDWLEGVTIVHTTQNQTLLSGSVRDQAALYGLIIKLRNLGVKLVSMNYGDKLCEEILDKEY
jgi:hypothetical protein